MAINWSPRVHRRSNSIDRQGKLVDIPTGLDFISVTNGHKRFFVLSTKNAFGIVRVQRVPTDSGSSSLLLPLESAQELRRILARSRLRSAEMAVESLQCCR